MINKLSYSFVSNSYSLNKIRKSFSKEIYKGNDTEKADVCKSNIMNKLMTLKKRIVSTLLYNIDK